MITALHSTDSVADLDAWASTYGIEHYVGLDENRETVWDLYSTTNGRPQYAVLNRNMDVVFEGRSRSDAEETAAGLLAP